MRQREINIQKRIKKNAGLRTKSEAEKREEAFKKIMELRLRGPKTHPEMSDPSKTFKKGRDKVVERCFANIKGPEDMIGD